MAEDSSQPHPASAPSEAPAQAVPATPPVAASSAADPSTPPIQSPTVATSEDATTRGRGADVAAYKKDFEDYLNGKLDMRPETPSPAAPVELEAQAPASIAAPETPTTTAPVSTQQSDDDEPPLPQDGSLPKNIKMRVKDAFDLEVLSLRKRGYDWADAQDMAAKRYPESPEARALAARQASNGNGSHAPDPAAPAPAGQPTTLAELDSALDAADRAYNAAVLNYDEDAMNTARAEARKLSAMRSDLAEAERHAVSQSQEAFNAEFNEYLQQAEALFPAAKDPQSPLSQRAAAIQAQLGRDGSPLYSLAESALIVFQRAAKELGVAPSHASAPSSPPVAHAPVQAATPTPQPSPRPRNPGAALLAGGNARTQQPGAPPEVDFSKMTRKNYDAYLDKFLQTSAA